MKQDFGFPRSRIGLWGIFHGKTASHFVIPYLGRKAVGSEAFHRPVGFWPSSSG